MVKKSTGKKEKSPFIITKRRDGRYAVKKRAGGKVHGPEKTEVLLSKGLIKLSKKKADAAT